MQRAKGTHVSQAMFIMCEVTEMPNEETQPIRAPNATILPTQPGGVPTDMIEVADLTPEAQGELNILLEVMEYKVVGKTSLRVERLCALLDPRRKSLGGGQLVNEPEAHKSPRRCGLERDNCGGRECAPAAAGARAGVSG